MAATLARLNANASTNYYAKDNYYNHNRCLENSSWFGKGAQYFALEGPVDPLKFKYLMEGKDPTGEKYLAGVKPRERVNKKTGEKEAHRAGVDITFAPPKSVSLAVLLDGRKDVEAAHRNAVQNTLVEIEKKMSVCRIGGRGEQVDKVCGNLIVARFEHNTSRSKDPQIHTHCVIISALKKEDGGWRRLQNNVFWNNSKYINDYYLQSLKTELRKIHVPLLEKLNSKEFEIEGYHKTLIEGFSKQTKKIKEMHHQGKFQVRLKEEIKGGREEPQAQKYVERSLKMRERDNKGKEISREELKAAWDKEKDSLLNINLTHERIKDDILILASGFIAKNTMKIMAKEFSFAASALTQIIVGSQLHNASLGKETYSFSASLMGGFIGGAIGDVVAGPAGGVVGDIIGAGIAQDIAENSHKYFYSSMESADSKISIEKQDSYQISSHDTDKQNNLKKEALMRSEKKEKFKEAESKKDYNKDLRIELTDKNREQEKSSEQKDVGEKDYAQHSKKELKGEEQEEKKSSENKEQVKEDKSKEQDHYKEIDFDNWGRGR